MNLFFLKNRRTGCFVIPYSGWRGGFISHYASICFRNHSQVNCPLLTVGSVDPYVTVGSLLLLKTFLLVLMDAAACYIFIYFLLPQFIKGKWLKPLVNTLLLGIFMFGAAWFMYWSVFPFVDSLFGAIQGKSLFHTILAGSLPWIN